MSKTTDWADIRLRYQKGESLNSIADSVDVTRQAIAKRRDKEGWVIEAQVTGLPATIPMELITHQDERKALILKALSEGKRYKVAAGYAGVSEDSERRWRKEDESYRLAVYRAKAWHLGRLEGNIGDAADRDWKAAAYLLERDPMTKSQYKQNTDGPGVAVQFNIGINRDEVKIGE